MISEKVKSQKVLLSKSAKIDRNCNLTMGYFIYLIVNGIIICSDPAFVKSKEIFISIPVVTFLFFLISFLIPAKSAFHKSFTYKGSLEDLIKEMYIYGFEVKDKLGELYVFKSYYSLFKRRMLAKDKGGICELFGVLPYELYEQLQKSNYKNENNPHHENNKRNNFKQRQAWDVLVTKQND